MAAVTRRAAILVLVLAGLLGVAVGFPSAHASPSSTLSAAGQEGLAQVATCLRSNPNLVALLVIDESSSLRETDPQNRRAGVLADFVTSLSGTAGQETPGGPRKVEFAVNTFASDSRTLVPWTSLNSQNESDISDELRTVVPGLNTGGATNYEAAIRGARSSIAQGVSEVGGSAPPCKLVAWFTDGVLDLGTNSLADNDASSTRLCATKGVVDALRRDGINLISVMLFDHKVQGASEVMSKGSALLQSTAEGAGGIGKYESQCGKQPIPADYARGAYFDGNVDALAGLFGQVIALGSGGTSVPDLVGTPLTFTIDPGFTSFWITAQAPKGFTLTSPAGDSLSGRPGTPAGAGAGATVAVSWTGTTFTAKVPITAQGLGTWKLARTGMTDGVGVYLFSNYSLEVSPSLLVADEQATIKGRVVDSAGQAVDLSGLSSAKLTVSQVVDGKQVDPVPFVLEPQTGSFTGTFIPQTTSTEVRFDLTLDMVTRSGFALAPLTTSFVQQVKLPGAYPGLSPASLSLGSVLNRGDKASAKLLIAGSPDGPTQVCVRSVGIDTTVPEAGITAGSSPASGCVLVDASGAASIDVAVELGKAVLEGGQVSGHVELSVTNAPTSQLPQTRERTVIVPFNAQVVPVKPLLWVPIVLLFAGLVIPLLILGFLNWWAARLSLGGLMMARVPVRVPLESGGILTRVDGKARLLTHDDLAFTPAPERARSWQPGTERVRARAPLSPFGSLKACVVAPEGSLVVSDRQPNLTASGRLAGIDLCPSMSAYLLIDRQALAEAVPGDFVAGELVAYLVPEVLERDAQHLAEEIMIFGAWSALALQLKGKGVVVAAAPVGGGGNDALPPPESDKRLSL